MALEIPAREWDVGEHSCCSRGTRMNLTKATRDPGFSERIRMPLPGDEAEGSETEAAPRRMRRALCRYSSLGGQGGQQLVYRTDGGDDLSLSIADSVSRSSFE